MTERAKARKILLTNAFAPWGVDTLNIFLSMIKKRITYGTQN
jgi:hypothetical protein